VEKRSYVLWVAIIASFGGLIFGYDSAVIAGAVGYLTDYFKLSPSGVGWSVSSALVGCVAGAAVAGEIGNRFGRKRTLMFAAICYAVSGLGTALAWSFTSFWLFRILGGAAIGLSVMIPLYVSEIAPKEMRGRLASLYQLAITLGVVIVFIANWGISNFGASTADWGVNHAWRWMLGSVTLPAAVFAVLLLFLPESPRWLLLQNRDAEARKILDRLATPPQIEEILREHAADVHAQATRGTVALWSAHIFPILLTACVLGILQQAVGINVIIYYGTKLMSQMRIGGANGAFFQQVLVGVALFVATFIGIALVDHWGRRPLLLVGSLGVSATILTVGAALMFHAEGPWLLSVILLYIVFFAATLGPIVWVMIAELAPDAARARVVSIASLCLWLANIAVSQTFPMVNDSPVNKTQFNGALPFFIYGAFGIIFFVFTLLRVPETKGRSLGEMGHIPLG